MPLSFSVAGGSANKPVVYIHDTDSVSLSGMTIDGAGLGNSNYRYQGIGYHNAGGMVTNCDIVGVMDTPFSGSQHGVGLYAYNEDGLARTLNMYDCTVTNFQKTAVAIGGDGLDTTVKGCTVIGAGSTDVTAQNGIQVYYGAVGTIESNVVLGVKYAPADWTASAILLYNAGTGTTVSGNEISGQTGIYAQGTANVTITGNTLANTDGLTDWAVFVYLSDNATVSGNIIADANESGLDVYESNSALVEANTLTGNPYAIGVTASLDTEIHDNIIEDNITGLIVDEISTADASYNYWGAADPDFDTQISGTGAYLPYYTDETLTTLYYPVYIGGTGYVTIQDAVDAAAPGDVITVDSGSFVEDVTVNKALTLAGANAGVNAVTGPRTAESSVSGGVTVQSDNVIIDGITLTNPDGTTGVYAYNVSGLTVQNNIITAVNTNGTGSASAVYVKALGAAETGFTVTGNDISDIGSTNATVSTKGIYFGDSNGDAVLSNVLIQSNRVAGVKVKSVAYELGGRGAYGILLNYGVYAAGYMDNVQVLDNIITGLEGYWIHGIGLETDTRNTVVQGNILDSFNSANAAGIFFEGNPSAPSVDVSFNTIDPSAGYGVAMHPNDLGSYTVDASENYWGQDTGPAEGQVSDGVDIDSYYTDPAFTTLYAAVLNITQNTGFASIIEAVAAANAGDTLVVDAGIYDEAGQIFIDKDLNIVGADRAATIIRPLQDTATSGDARGWFLVDSGIEFNLSGVTLDGNGYLIYQAIRQKGSGTIADVSFHDIRYQYDGSPYAGVAIAAFGTGPVDVYDSTFDEIGRVGVLYFGSTLNGSVFAGNTYTGKGPGDWLDYCLDISAGANVMVSNNIITGCSGVASSDGSTSAGVMATTYFGAGTGAEVVDNVITGNYQGITVGYDTNDTSIVTAQYNNLSGNDYAVTAQDDVSVDATLNYFGSEDPDFGALLEGPVAYDPWYIDEALTQLRLHELRHDPVGRRRRGIARYGDRPRRHLQ
jgi:parallel beta-helix repeat protein